MASSSKQKRKSVEPLPSEVRSHVRSGITITSIAQCVDELVYNAIDAGAKNIHILINVDQFNVRIEDDGEGISEADMEAIGQRYSTSKCHSLADLSNLRHYGFRGEALASIIDVSSTVDVVTRAGGIELRKKFEEGRPFGCIEKCNTKNLKSETAVIVGRLLSKFPVRQKRIDKSIQQEDVKTNLERIALVNPGVNITLRNDDHKLFEFKASLSYSEAFNKLYQSRLGFEVNFEEEHYRYQGFFFKLSVSRSVHKKKHYQFVFVNNRVTTRNRVHKHVGEAVLEKLGSDSKGDKYPIFILNITCALNECDILLEPKKQKIKFKDWDAVKAGLEGLLLKLPSQPKANPGPSDIKRNLPVTKRASFISSHNLRGALHTRVIDRSIEASGSSKGSGSDRVGSFSNNSSTSGNDRNQKRNVLRTGHTTRTVDVKAIRKRKKESAALAKMNPPPQMLYSIDNKPRLTMGVFEKFSDWKNEFNTDHSRQNVEVPPKRFKEAQNFQRSPATTARETASTSAKLSNSRAVENTRSSESEEPHHSPSAKSIFHWKMDRFLCGCTPEDSTAKGDANMKSDVQLDDDSHSVIILSGLNSENSLAGLSDSVSAFVPEQNRAQSRRDCQATLIQRADTFIQENYIEKNNVPAIGTLVLSEIFGRYQSEMKSKSLNIWKVPTSRGVSRMSKKPHLPEVSISSSNSNETSNLIAPPTAPFKIPAPPPPIYPSVSAPPLLNMYPYQKQYSTEWNDQMLSTDYVDTNSELFSPDNWSVEIVMDGKGQEWLQTEDNLCRKVYINLATGDSSYDMIHSFKSVKVSSEEMKKCNPARYTWLRKHFPRGFKQFLNHGEREVRKDGDMRNVENSILKDSLNKCLSGPSTNEKWYEYDYKLASKYFDSTSSKAAALTDGKFVNMQCWKSDNGRATSVRFSREDFQHVTVIGQLDKKFILAGIRKSMSDTMMIVIFDQHAVHERIRLEKLTTEAISHTIQGKKYLRGSEITPCYLLSLPESDVRLMMHHKDVFNQVGIKYEIASSSSVSLMTVTRCFFDEPEPEPIVIRDTSFWIPIRNLIQEVIHHIMETRGASLVVLPKTIHETLCSKACHRAIKFGDELDLETCCKLIYNLKKCKSLFQCAHGRPSVVPLLKPDDVLKTAMNDSEPLNLDAAGSQDHESLLAHHECSSYFCSAMDDVKVDQADDPTSTFDVFNTCDSTNQQPNVDDELNDSPYFF